MKNILLVSATSGNNYNLAKAIEVLLKTKDIGTQECFILEKIQ